MEICGRDLWKIFEVPSSQKTQRVVGRRHTVHDPAPAPAPAPLPVTTASSTQGKRIWCHCRRSSFDDMVMCDDDGCTTKWFHMSCVKMTMANVPDVWYCTNCRK